MYPEKVRLINGIYMAKQRAATTSLQNIREHSFKMQASRNRELLIASLCVRAVFRKHTEHEGKYIYISSYAISMHTVYD